MKFSVVIFLSFVFCAHAVVQTDTVFQWKFFDFDFTDPNMRRDYINSNAFVPGAGNITGMQIFGGKIYLSFSRQQKGVPSVLNVIPLSSGYDTSPKLSPYPNWEVQKISDNCDGLFSVGGIEIDPFGRLWVLDDGHVGYDASNAMCKPKLVIFDLDTNNEVRKFEFQNDIVSHKRGSLSNIVIDCEVPKTDEVVGTSVKKSDSTGTSFASSFSYSYSSQQTPNRNCFAFITDKNDSSIVTYSLADNQAWKFTHETMKPDSISRSNNTFNIALSPAYINNRTLYYSASSDGKIYSVNATLLKTNSPSDIANSIKVVAEKTSEITTMIMDNKGVLYYNSLPENAIYNWTITFNSFNPQLLKKNDTSLFGAVAMAFANGNLYAISNAKQKTLPATYDNSNPSIFLLRMNTNSDSYVYENKSTTVFTEDHQQHHFKPQNPVKPTVLRTTLKPGTKGSKPNSGQVVTSAFHQFVMAVLCLMMSTAPMLVC